MGFSVRRDFFFPVKKGKKNCQSTQRKADFDCSIILVMKTCNIKWTQTGIALCQGDGRAFPFFTSTRHHSWAPDGYMQSDAWPLLAWQKPAVLIHESALISSQHQHRYCCANLPSVALCSCFSTSGLAVFIYRHSFEHKFLSPLVFFSPLPSSWFSSRSWLTA